MVTHTSSSAIRKGAVNTRMSRLTANEGVLSKGTTQDTRVLVMSENDFGIVIKGTDNKPVVGVSVTAKDLNGKTVKTLKTEDPALGIAKFNANDFVSNYDKEIEISLEVDASAQGYRSFSIPWLVVKRGGHRDEHLVPLSGSGTVTPKAAGGVKPYIVSATFNGYDILRQDKQTIISRVNDANVNFEVVMEHASGASVKPPVLHYWKNEFSGGSVFPKEQTMNPTSTEKVSATRTKFIWKSTWKRDLSPDTKKEERPYFELPDTGEKVHTTLLPIRSVIDQPTTGDNYTLDQMLNKGFGLNVTLPGIGGNLSLNLPYDKYLPKISTDPSGFFTVTIGSSLVDPNWPASWKSEEKEKYDKVIKDFQHATSTAQKKQLLGTAKEYYKKPSLKGEKTANLGKVEFDFGLFLMLSGRKEKDLEEKTKLWSGTGVAGVKFMFSVDYTKPFSVGPIPVYVNINFGATAGFGLDGLAFTFQTTDPGLAFKNFHFQPLKGINISIRLALTATFGIGIKGLLSAWVSATGALTIDIQLLVSDPTRVAVYLEGMISVGVEIFWIKYTREVLKSPKVRLWSNYDMEKKSAGVFSLFAAYAEGSSDKKDSVELLPEEPERYTALALNADKVITNQDNAKAGIKVVQVDGHTYVFYLGSAKSKKDGNTHRRLCWLDVKTKKSGSTQESLDLMAVPHTDQFSAVYDKEDYAFDVVVIDKDVYALVLCGKDFDSTTGLPKASFDDKAANVNTFYYYSHLTPGKDGLYMQGSYGSTWWAKNKDTCYPLCANPRIESVKQIRRLLGVERTIYGTFDGYGEDGKRAGYNLFAITVGPRINLGNVNARFSKDSAVLGSWKSSEQYRRVALRSNARSDASLSNTRFPGNPSFGWVGISSPIEEGKGDSYLELFDYDMNNAKNPKSLVLEQGEFGAFEPVQKVGADGKVTQTIFFTKAVSAGDRKQYRLRSITIQPKEGSSKDLKFNTTFTDYDVSLPVTDFRCVTIGSYQYLYWISADAKKKEGNPDVWRVTGVYLDPNSGIMSDQMVLAEFTLPDADWRGKKYKSVPYEVMLTNADTGYITAKPDTGDEKDREIAPMTLYSFPVKLNPSLDLKKAALTETTIIQGEFVNTDVSVMNDGSVGISGFDLELWQVVNGQEKTKVETLHADCVNTGNSSLVLHDAKGNQTVAKGDKAFYRYKDFNYSPRQREWLVNEDPKTFSVQDGDRVSVALGNNKSKRVSTNVLVPGALAGFKGCIKIPSDWAGKYDLRFKITNVTTYTNWLGVAAKAASDPEVFAKGEQAALDEIGGAKLVYQLDEASGRLVLQDQVVAKGESDETLTLYPDSIPAPEPIGINCDMHDIDVDHRLYTDSYGQEMLDITINNYYHNRENIELTCGIYINDSESPYYVNLPYSPEEVAAGKTTTITLPLDALLDSETTESARFVITARDIDETALVNNEFMIYPGGSNDLEIAAQPESTTVRPGGRAVFTVMVIGGDGRYTYQWQVFVNGKWQNVTGATGDTLILEHVRPEWNGRRTRCIIADGGRTIQVDGNGNPIIPEGEEDHYVVSGEAVLRVLGGGVGGVDEAEDEHPDTGDHANLPLYLTVAAIALALLILLRRRMAQDGSRH